jgi:hypothetical protein
MGYVSKLSPRTNDESQGAKRQKISAKGNEQGPRPQEPSV